MKITLNPDEKEVIVRLASALAARYGSAEHPEFLAEAPVLAHELPMRVRKGLNEFRLYEPKEAICNISGYPIDDREIGATPAHWKDRQTRCVPVKEEITLVLLGSLLGDLIAWSTQQDGAVVHDIAPIKGHEHEQLGSGSEEELTWHTEDAFHPYRGDYLGMLCLRNPDRVPTTFAPIDVEDLDEATVATLFEPYYTIRPDESHLRKNRVAPSVDTAFLEAAQARIEKMNESPERIGVLFGSPQSPYCRIDPYFMDPVESEAAREALALLIRRVDTKIGDLLQVPGDFCFIDNFKAVHGRRRFVARFDGTDRWLKRINITRDLRRSRSARPAPECRTLY